MLLLIFLAQVFLFVVKSSRFGIREARFQPDHSAQAVIDSMVMHYESAAKKDIRPFNPNFLTDFKGYMLGMSPDEIDSLHAFRETGRFLQSPDEFQSITGVSDSFLAEIAVYFKFPGQRSLRPEKNRGQLPQGRIVDKVRQDLNTASAIDLMKIRGIGEVLSARILKFRKALGGFVVAEQLYDVYGLDKAVADRVLEKYTVVKKPQIRLIDLNLASVEEISSSVYITNALARRIVAYRNINGPFEAWDELTKIEDFPIQQIDRIKLYLTL